jgi:serine/threonine protein kinase
MRDDSPEPPIREGDLLAGKYRVDRVLGGGAMSVVVAATRVDTGEPRAVKVLLPSALENAEWVERFLREAQATVRLASPHVVRVDDVGRLEDATPYIAMELLEGTDLRALLEARGALPVAEAVGYALQVAEALSEAHAHSIVHRDLKPANLFVTRAADGAPLLKVLDFGIAKVPDDRGPHQPLTGLKELLGTPLYMSPEQVRSARDVDTRTDLWSLGVVLYRMLTGRTPFTGGTPTEIFDAVLNGSPAPPAALRPEVPPALSAAVMRCLEKRKGRRFATVAELAAALRPFAKAPELRWPPPPPSTQRRPPARRGRAWLLGIGAAAVIAAAVVIGVMLLGR